MSKNLTPETVPEASMADLLAYYNENAEKPVTRFADRKTAERRVLALFVEPEDDIGSIAMGGLASETPAAPANHIKLSSISKTNTKAAAPISPGKDPNGVQHIKAPKAAKEVKAAPEKAPLVGGKNPRMSEAQRIAWKDSDTYEARSERSAVMVDGIEYKSVPKAFAALGLPKSKLVRFRSQLKDAGKMNEFGHEWEIVPLNY